MKRSIVITLLLVSFSIGFGQHLTYSSFIKMTKIQEWGQLSDALGEYGYVYSGSKQDTITGIVSRRAVWVKNCQYDFSKNKYTYNVGVDFSKFEVTDNGENNKTYSYLFPNKSSYKTFISTAQKNGFIFVDDILTDYFITTTYRRDNKQSGLREIMIVSEANDGSHTVHYYWNKL